MSSPGLERFDRDFDFNAENLILSNERNAKIKQIRQIVKNAIDKLTTDPSPASLKEAEKLLSKVTKLNLEIETRTNESPLKNAMHYLSGKIEEVRLAHLPQSDKVPSSPQVQTTEPIPVQLKQPTELQTASPTTSTLESTPSEVSYEGIQEKISRLDLSSSQLPKQIQEIQKDLEALNKTGTISKEQLKTIKGALDSLYKPGYFLPSVFEANLVDRIGKLLLSITDEFPQCEQRAIQDARVQLLDTIKKGSKTPKGLALNINRTLHTLQENLPKTRFSYLPEQLKTTPPLNGNFIRHLPQLLGAMKNLNEELFEQYPRLWEKELKPLEKLHPGFSSFLEKNFASSGLKTLCDNVSDHMHGLFDLHYTNSLNDVEFDKYLSLGLSAGKNRLAEGFKENLRVLHPMHQWLSDNFEAIKNPYDQALASHTNLGFGNCFANCIDRHRVLLDNPGLPGKNISMGSTPEGRFAQVIMIHNVKSKKISGGTADDRINTIHKSAKRLLTPSKPVKTFGMSSLKEEMNKAYRENDKNLTFILDIIDKSGGCHAINIQLDGNIDPKMFRFIDDNAGVF